MSSDSILDRLTRTLEKILEVSQANKTYQEKLLEALVKHNPNSDDRIKHVTSASPSSRRQFDTASSTPPATVEGGDMTEEESLTNQYIMQNILNHFAAKKSDPNSRIEISAHPSNNNLSPNPPSPIHNLAAVKDHSYERSALLPLIPFGSYFKNDCTQINIKIRQWTGQLYYSLCQVFFQKYAKSEIDKDELKMLFSQAIIYNAVKMMESISGPYPITWEEKKAEFLNQFDQSSKNALAFLMRKYPIKPRGAVHVPSLGEDFSEFNTLWEPHMNTLYDSMLRLTYREDRQYWRQIKEVLNFYIKETKARQADFKRQMKETFNFTASDNVQMCMMESKRPIDVSMSYFHPENKQYTLKYLIGMKVPSTTPCYTQSEIQQKGVKIKNPEMLRIIIKWIENLEKVISMLTEDSAETPLSFVKKQDRKLAVDLSSGERGRLQQIAKEESRRLLPYSEYSKQIKQTLGNLHSLIKKYDSNFIHIPSNEVIVGLATATVATPIYDTMIDFLESLLHTLLLIEKRFNKEQPAQRAVCLLYFGIYDLLRAKCTGSKIQLLTVYRKMLDRPDIFKIARVKNRLDTVNRDYLINFRFRKTHLICELQLAVALEDQHEDSKKKHKLVDFSHFLYEMQRSKYGPLTQAFMTNNHTNPAVAYFEEALKTVQASALAIMANYNPQNNTIEVPNCKILRKSPTGFCCANCWRFVSAGNQLYESLDDRSDLRICFKCVHDAMSEKDRISYMLGHVSEVVEPLPNLDQLAGHKYLLTTKEQANMSTNYSVFRIVELDGQVLLSPCLAEFPYPVVDVASVAGKEFFVLKPSVTLKSLDSRSVSEEDIMLTPNGKLSAEFDKKTYLLAVSLDNSRNWIVDFVPEDTWDQKSRFCRKVTLMLQQSSSIRLDLAELTQKIQNFVRKSEIDMSSRNFANLQLFQFNKLRSLSLRKNKIKQLNLGKLNLENLQLLDLGYNYLKKISVKRVVFPSLKKLKLDNNSIAALHMIETTFPRIELVDLAQNKLEQIPTEFKDETFEHCNTIILEHNQIKNVHFSMFGTYNLQKLILNNNMIRSVSGLKDIPSSLLYLNLEDNFLEQIDFEGMVSSLQRLDLGSNRLRKLKRLTPSSLENLNQLSLACNYLSDLDMKMFSRAKLNVLYLHSNECTDWSSGLRCLDLSQISRLSLGHPLSEDQMKQLHLPHTHFKCSVNEFLPIYKFLTWLVNKGDLALQQQIMAVNLAVEDKQAKSPSIRILSISPEYLQSILHLRHRFKQYLYSKGNT